MSHSIRKRRRTSRRRITRNGDAGDRQLAKEFRRLVNMTPGQIDRWRRDQRSREASYPSTRRELSTLAEMKRRSPQKWTPKMWGKAKRAVAFIKRHEAQMKAQAKRYGGSGAYHYTRKRVIALLNWGRITPGVKVEGL